MSVVPEPVQVYVEAVPLGVKPNTFTYTYVEEVAESPEDCEWCDVRDPAQVHAHDAMFRLKCDGRTVYVCHPCMNKLRRA